MPNLLPIKSTSPAPDLAAVFDDSITTATVERVIKFLSPFYFEHSNKSFDERARPNFITEEFCLFMPTRAAWASELRLCEAILGHAAGKSDKQIKAVLIEYLASHTFVYSDAGGFVKSGEIDNWTHDVDLYYLEFENNSAVCNPVQAWLVKFLEKDKNIKAIKL